MNPLWNFLFSYGNRTLVQGKEWAQKKSFFVVLKMAWSGPQEWSWDKVSSMCEGTAGGLELHGLGYT